MANVFYDNAKKNLWNGAINLATDPLNVALVGPGYVPNQAVDQYWSDVAANEVSGTGYTAGGQALSGQSVTADTTNHRGKFTADNVTWPNATVTAVGAVIYKKAGTPSTSPIVGYIDFGGAKSSSAGNFTIQWDATNGIAYF
jgi:hypothetical protein